MIVATAGHIDHGKTALIKALTGVDADRLPEEKKRGITVDLGFAYQRDAQGNSLGFIDVPGHEKLVRTMLAGASGVDFVMLVVAADDGIMPQTREHLAILDLLGIARGVAVLTKLDKVEPDRATAVTAEIHALLRDTTLAGIDVLPVSAHRGDGIEDLRTILAVAAAETGSHRTDGAFRLAIDRAFTLSGAGLVVTGTVHAGRVAAGDRLLLAPLGREVRVRSLHAQNEAAESGGAGQRCALNITGARVQKADIARGDWIVGPALETTTSRADVRLRLLPSETKPLRHWAPVHVHIGAADIPGRIALLEGGALQPGASMLGQIVLDHPTSALNGDRFVLRDQSAQRTIGGGRVIDPLPPARNTRKPERLAFLRAFDHADDGAALDALLADAPRGLDAGHFAFARNVEEPRLDALRVDRDIVVMQVAGKTLFFTRACWSKLREAALAALGVHQTKNPDSFGATTVEMLRSVPALTRPAMSAALDELVSEKAIVRFGRLLHLPGHEVKLSLDEENLWFEIERYLVAQDIDPPRLALICEVLRLEEGEVKPLLEKLARMGRLRRASKTYFVLPDVARRLAEAAAGCATAHEQAILTVGQFRDATGISRNATMPMLEFFDRLGLTTRFKDGRKMRGGIEAIFGE
jgi:selenocysteine-specific elongation factor